MHPVVLFVDSFCVVVYGCGMWHTIGRLSSESSIFYKEVRLARILEAIENSQLQKEGLI